MAGNMYFMKLCIREVFCFLLLIQATKTNSNLPKAKINILEDYGVAHRIKGNVENIGLEKNKNWDSSRSQELKSCFSTSLRRNWPLLLSTRVSLFLRLQ